MYKQTLSEFSTFDTPGQFFKLFVLSLGMLARWDWNLLDTALFDHRPAIMEAESDLIRRTSAPQACFWTRVKSVCVASMQKPTFGPIIVTLCQLPILHNPHICRIIPFFFFFSVLVTLAPKWDRVCDFCDKSTGDKTTKISLISYIPLEVVDLL